MGNRYRSFRTRHRTGIVREIMVFAVLNDIGLLIQDAALAMLFRFWSYRRFAWVTSREDS